MKTILCAFAASLFFLASCGGSSAKPETHTHEDGTSHSEHSGCGETDKNAHQEHFTLDSMGNEKATENQAAADHTHDHDHDHSGHKH